MIKNGDELSQLLQPTVLTKATIRLDMDHLHVIRHFARSHRFVLNADGIQFKGSSVLYPHAVLNELKAADMLTQDLHITARGMAWFQVQQKSRAK